MAPMRQLGDSLTWMIPFDTSGIRMAETPSVFLEHEYFCLQDSVEGSGTILFCISSERFIM